MVVSQRQIAFSPWSAPRSVAVCLHVALLADVCDAAQLPLARELLVQGLELVDELLAHGAKDLARRLGAVGLQPDEQLWYVGVADWGRRRSAVRTR